MNLRALTYELQFKFPFVLAAGTRSSTPAIYLRLQHNQTISWAEAALPPYFKLTSNQLLEILKQNDIKYWLQNNDSFSLNNYLQNEQYLPQPVNALLISLLINQHPWIISEGNYQSTLTVSASSGISAKELLKHQSEFSAIKIKIGTGDEKSFIDEILKHTTLPFCVDVNRGWKNRDHAASLCEYLEKKACLLIEQPFESSDLESHLWLRKQTSIKIIADESICTFFDLQQKHEAFDGVNIKLLKCGGGIEAQKMIDFAKENKLITLLGCMSESSLGCATAARLVNQVDYCDLDGPYLISNDPFTGYALEKGKIKLGNQGIQPAQAFITSFSSANAVTL